MKFFNTAGPMKSDIHYCLRSLDRLDKAELLSLIEAFGPVNRSSNEGNLSRLLPVVRTRRGEPSPIPKVAIQSSGHSL